MLMERRAGKPLVEDRCSGTGTPTWVGRSGDYVCDFAASLADLREVQALRYRVFNVELGEGLEDAHATGLDADAFDACSHHLRIRHTSTGEVVGTYRLLTAELVAGGDAFYSAREFDLSGLPAEIPRRGVELGRACIAREHRGHSLLALLWRGIATYLLDHDKRYLFGCASLPDDDPSAALRAYRVLRRRRQLHEGFEVKPRPGFEVTGGDRRAAMVPTELPDLLEAYLSLGARICGPPAADREFGTNDFFVLLDLEEVDEHILRRFTDR